MHPTRVFFTACFTIALAACSTIGAMSAWLNDQVTFSAPQLQRYLDQHFPRDFDKLGGLVSITLANPRLSLPPGDGRLRLEFDMGIGALGSRGVPNGHLSLSAGLRYDASTQGLHLVDPELLQFDLPGSGSLLKGGARGVVNSLLAEYARNEPVYRLEPALLDKLPAGKRIGAVDIDDGRVIVRLQ